jgi:hypothetical protein
MISLNPVLAGLLLHCFDLKLLIILLRKFYVSRDYELSHHSSIINSFIHSSMALQPCVGPWPLLHFRNLFCTDSRTPWTSDQPVTRPLLTHRTTQTQNERTHRHSCLEWDSNTRSQRSSERRQFIPQTARPLQLQQYSLSSLAFV